MGSESRSVILSSLLDVMEVMKHIILARLLVVFPLKIDCATENCLPLSAPGEINRSEKALLTKHMLHADLSKSRSKIGLICSSFFDQLKGVCTVCVCVCVCV